MSLGRDTELVGTVIEEIIFVLAVSALMDKAITERNEQLYSNHKMRNLKRKRGQHAVRVFCASFLYPFVC